MRKGSDREGTPSQIAKVSDVSEVKATPEPKTSGAQVQKEKEIVDDPLCESLALRLADVLSFGIFLPQAVLRLHSETYFALRGVSDEEWYGFSLVGLLLTSGCRFQLGGVDLVLRHFPTAGFWCVYTAEADRRLGGNQGEDASSPAPEQISAEELLVMESVR